MRVFAYRMAAIAHAHSVPTLGAAAAAAAGHLALLFASGTVTTARDSGARSPASALCTGPSHTELAHEPAEGGEA